MNKNNNNNLFLINHQTINNHLINCHKISNNQQNNNLNNSLINKLIKFKNKRKSIRNLKLHNMI